MRILALTFLSLTICVAALTTTGPAWGSELGRQVAVARAAAAAYPDLRSARRDGWRRFGGAASLMGQHFYRPRVENYLPGQPLDPARPSNLIFAEIGGRQVLVSLAYNYQLSDRDALPAGFAGRSDVWHVHDVGRFVRSVTQDRPLLRGVAERFLLPAFGDDRGVQRDRLAMVHLWTIPNPDGAFASHNRLLPYLQLGLPADWVNGASKSAARGLSLATPDGCATEIDAEAWFANISRAVKRELYGACRSAAAHIRDRLGSKAQANAAGEAGWAHYTRIRDAALTPAQKLRISSIVEDGPGVLCKR